MSTSNKYPSDRIKETYTIWSVAEKINCPLPKGSIGSRPKCPFCGSQSGFSVKKDQFFRCYRCQKKGSVIDFTMFWLSCSFTKAIKTLSPGLKVESLDFSQSNIREKAFQYYQEAFEESLEAQEYAKSRGWNYPMGFAPHSRYLQDRGISIEELEPVNLLLNKSDHNYEFFQNRLIFPIKDMEGRIAHFQGRSLDPSSKIKWLSTSSKETSINHYVFNGDLLSKYCEEEFVFLAEGIGDTLALLNLGLPAVGILGNYMPLKGYKKVLENFKAICFCLDNDCYELGTEYSGRYKSWSRMLPEVIDLQNTINVPVYCYTPPSISGVSDINEFVEQIDYDKEEFLQDVNKRSKLVDKMAWEVFSTDDPSDLFFIFQSLKSPFSSLNKAFQDRIEKLYSGKWIEFFKEISC